MKEAFLQRLSDAWYFLKIKLHIPLPLKNHFYKGRRISTKRNWFCKSCLSIFHRSQFGRMNQPMSSLVCRVCGSKEWQWSTGIFKAVVDGKSKEEIYLLTTKKPVL